jgi:hypothetical protein
MMILGGLARRVLLSALLPWRGAFASPPAQLNTLLTAHCLDCHDGARAKGGFDLAGIIAAGEVERGGKAPGRGQRGAGAATAQRSPADAWMTAADPTLLRAMRARLARQDMPPASIDERPSDAEYAAMIAAIDAVVPPESREVPVVRRADVPCSHDPPHRRRRIHRKQLRPFVV